MKAKQLLLAAGVLFGVSIAHAQTLKEQAQAKISELNTLISTAQGQGIDVRREQLSVRTAEIFLRYADWDASHVSNNTAYFQGISSSNAAATDLKNNAATRAAELPDFERNEVIAMLTRSITDINQVLSGGIVRKPVPAIDWAGLNIVDDQVMYNSKPVFLSQWIWKPEGAEFDEFFGQADGFYLTPAHISNETGTYSQQYSLQNKATGKFGDMYLDHTTLPSWLTTKYPTIDDFAHTYTKYDIDHAATRQIQRLLLSKVAPLMSGKNYSKTFLLCNEPHFHTAVGSSNTAAVSDSTKAKFRQWLQTKHASIADLNTLWGTSFASFDAVTVTIPMATNLRGNAQWYDWMSFNMDRVTDWFTFLHDEIYKYDTQTKTHLKVMAPHWGGSIGDVDNGMDMEALMNLCEILGNDAGGAKLTSGNYGLNWRELCTFYDFCKSIAPNKLLVNSETHFFSSFDFRDLYLSPEYARAYTWLAAMQGQNIGKQWVWCRLADGSINANMPTNSMGGCTMHQPRVVREIEATTMDLNAHSEAIVALQRLKKPIRIFYSKTSAINVQTYMNTLYSLYESLFFRGVPLGYATKGIITGQDNWNWDVILIYQTPNVTRAERDAVQAYLDGGGTVIMDGTSFKKDEYGRSNIPALTQSNGKLLITSSLAYMAAQAILNLKSGSAPEISITESNSIGANGCVWRCAKMAGKYVLSVLNVGRSAATLNITVNGTGSGYVFKDLLTGKTVSAQPQLQPYETFFVEISDVSSDIDPVTTTKDFAKIYPTKVENNLHVFFYDYQDRVNMTIYNMNGSVVKSEQFTGVKEISTATGTFSKGAYLVELVTDKQSQTLRFIK